MAINGFEFCWMIVSPPLWLKKSSLPSLPCLPEGGGGGLKKSRNFLLKTARPVFLS
jgi:hypothetical protein